MNTPYESRLHTPEALAQQMETLQTTEPGAFVVSSLGRAVHYQRSGLPGDTEFRNRGVHPLHAYGLARDIDLVIGHKPSDGLEPFPVDYDVFMRSSASMVRAGDEWWLTSSLNGFAAPLHEDVMRPVEGPGVYDIPTRTLPLQTMQAIHLVHRNMRRKDAMTARSLRAATHTVPTELPAELLRPFERLAELNHQELTLAQRAYFRLMPAWIDARWGKTIIGIAHRTGIQEALKNADADKSLVEPDESADY